MSIVKTPSPVIPSGQSDRDVITALNNLRNFFSTLDKNGGVVSAADMIGTGLINNNFKPNGPLYDGSIPPAVQNFTAVGAFRTIVLSWDTLAYNPMKLAYYEIFRSQTNNFGTAVKIGATTAIVYTDAPSDASLATTYYYWIRAVSVSNIAGPFNAVAGTSATTANDPTYLLQVLTGQLIADQLHASLLDPIQYITAPNGLDAQLEALSIAILGSISDLNGFLTDLVRLKAISDATVDIDPTTGQITLKATAAITTDIEARISSAEYNLNAQEGQIQSNVSELNIHDSRITDAESNITQLGNSISLKASTAYVDAKAQEVAAILGPEADNTLAFTTNVPEGLMWMALLSNTTRDLSRVNDANLATAQFNISSNADDIQAEATARLLLAAKVNDNAAAIIDEQMARVTAEGAIAQSVTTLETTVDGHTATIQTQQTSLNGIQAQYTIKLDVNGRVIGIGLMNDGATSEFEVVADKITFAPVATDPTAADGAPFFYLTSPQTVNGVTLQAGLYLKRAVIGAATITSAQVESLAADKLYAATGTIAQAIIGNGHISNAMIGQVIESDNWSSGVAGWYIGKSGYAEFLNILARGNIEATSIKVGTANIIDTLMLQGEVVTVPRSAVTASPQGLNGSWADVLLSPAYYVTSGLEHSVSVSAFASGNISASFVNDAPLARLVRYTNGSIAATSAICYCGSGTTLSSSSLSFYINTTGTGSCLLLDTPPAGTHYYAIQMGTRNGNAGVAYERGMTILGVKR